MQNSSLYRLFIGAVCGLVISACSSSNNNNTGGGPTTPPPPPPPPAMVTFEATVTNLTNDQPLSPVAIVAHADGYNPFEVGTTATVGLEMLAEAGDNAEFLNEAAADAATVATASGAGVIPPGASETISFQVLEGDSIDLQVSAMTMLVNTNDAITGVNAQDVSLFGVGQSVSTRTIAYDAGTEANTETAATIPGPAGGGEGFNAARDDRNDFVTMHSGVVSADDGLPTSDLTEAHRFDHPVMQVTLTRTQ